VTIELVIDQPAWQNPRQRLASWALLLCGWALWLYFAFPFVELCGWWLDVRVCSWWVNLSGGSLSLRILLFLYGKTLAGLLGGWCAWTVYNDRRERRRPAPCPLPVPQEDLRREFGVGGRQLALARNSRHTTVHFDSAGRILKLEVR